MNTIKNMGERAKEMNGSEGTTTKAIEQVTSSLPSSTWLLLAGGAVVGSLVFKMIGKNETANFIGQWAPTLLLLGIYNKVVKVMGSDREQAKARM